MSFLNSILSSIGGDKPSSPAPKAQATNPQPSHHAEATRPTEKSDSIPLSVQAGKKRKADDNIVKPGEKASKTYLAKAPNAVVPQFNVYQALTAKPNSYSPRTRPNSSVPYPGLGRPDSMSKPTQLDQEPSKKEPKKGSYAEIMARAKASEAKLQAVGTISHKPKDKGTISHKKELKLQKQARRDKKLGTVRDKDGSRPSSADGPQLSGKDARKTGQAEHVKPAKPKVQPSYTGTLKPASSTKAKTKAAATPFRRANEYAATDDEFDDEEVEDEDYGYDDDESDDMEAGFSDVEQEETSTARAARKEDEDEARLEAKLKREKEERKKKVLEDLAKKAKPKKY